MLTRQLYLAILNRIDPEENFRQQREWQNELEIRIEQHQIKDDELEDLIKQHQIRDDQFDAQIEQLQSRDDKLVALIGQHQRKDDELETQILLLEENQASINESVTEQQDFIRHLSEIQNEIKTRFELESEQQSTPLAIPNLSSKLSTLRPHTR